MKKNIIRKKYRSQQFKKLGNTILVFHCSAFNSHQWRTLKNAYHSLILSNGKQSENLSIRTLFASHDSLGTGPLCFISIPSSLRRGFPLEERRGQASLCSEKGSILANMLKIEPNLILFYGKLENQLMNHIDIKKVMQSDPSKDLLLSMNSPASQFLLLLHQSYQEMLHILSLRCQQMEQEQGGKKLNASKWANNGV